MAHTILIVEDHEDIARNISEYLELSGYIVTTAPTLRRAGELCEISTYDLLILDVGLPDGSGFDFAKLIRTRTNTPFLFLTARDAIEDRLKGFECGGIDYIVKPFDLRELVARIQSRFTPASHQSYNFGGIYLDFERQIFTQSGESIHLTQREQEILHLIIRSDYVISRSEIIESIWGEKALFESESRLDVHISSIRKKLSKDIIITLKGFGYRVKTKES